MTSPLGSPSFLSPSTSTTLYQETHSRIKEVALLIKDLLRFSLGSSSSSIAQTDQLLSMSNLQTIENLSSQLAELKRTTAKSCEEIAKTILATNISLHHCLRSQTSLSAQDLELVRKSLLQSTTISTPPSPSKFLDPLPHAPQKRSGVDDTTPLDTESHLPIKKRKLYRTAPEESASQTIEQCSSHALMILLQALTGEKTPATYQCPDHDAKKSCPTCVPINHVLSEINRCEKDALTLLWQIKTLQTFVSLQQLTSAITKHPDILNSVLEAHFLNNHALAVICLECDIDDSICSKNLPNPKHQAILYHDMHKLTLQGLSSPLVSQIQHLWNTFTFDSKSRITSIKVALNPEEKIYKTLSPFDFIGSIPKIERTYSFTNHLGYTYYSNRKSSEGFLVFVTQVVFKTVTAIKETPSLHHWLVTTPEGELVAPMSLLKQLLALILCSNKDCFVRVLPCKASVHKRQIISFDSSLTLLMHNALESFSLRNSIFLQGKNTHSKEKQKTHQ